MIYLSVINITNH